MQSRVHHLGAGVAETAGVTVAAVLSARADSEADQTPKSGLGASGGYTGGRL
jgi:hypothetical protein